MHRSTFARRLRSTTAACVLLGLLAAMSHMHGDAGTGHAAWAGTGHEARADTGHAASAGTGHAAWAEASSAIGFTTTPGDGDSPRLSSDDDHHEHSSTTTLAAEVCFGCRSRHDVDHALGGAHAAVEPATHRADDVRWRTPRAPNARGDAYAARAPPATRA